MIKNIFKENIAQKILSHCCYKVITLSLEYIMTKSQQSCSKCKILLFMEGDSKTN